MDWSQIWPVIGIVCGAGGFLTVSVQEFRKWRTGAAEEERLENNDLKTVADRAVVMRDWSDEYRRLVMEKAAKWRRIAIEHGVPEETLGPWPAEPPKP